MPYPPHATTQSTTRLICNVQITSVGKTALRFILFTLITPHIYFPILFTQDIQLQSSVTTPPQHNDSMLYYTSRSKRDLIRTTTRVRKYKALTTLITPKHLRVYNSLQKICTQYAHTRTPFIISPYHKTSTQHYVNLFNFNDFPYYYSQVNLFYSRTVSTSHRYLHSHTVANSLVATPCAQSANTPLMQHTHHNRCE